MTMDISLPHNVDWRREQQRWQTVYTRHLRGNLQQAVHYVRSTPPQVVRDHFLSLLAMLQEAHSLPDVLPEIVALVDALHPWPLRWGHWSAWEEQIFYVLEHATDLDDERRATFLMHLGQVYIFTGRKTLAEDAWKQATQLAKRAQVLTLLSDLVYHQATILWPYIEDDVETFETLKQYLNTHAKALSKSEKAHIQARLALSNASLKRRAGDTPPLAQEIDLAIQQVQRHCSEELDLLAELYTMQGTLWWEIEHFQESIISLEHALTHFQMLNDLFSVTEVHGNMGLVYWSMCALDEAEVHLRLAVRNAERLGARYRLVVDVGNLGLVALMRGDLSLAERYMQRQYLLAQRSGNQHESKRASGNLGIVYYHQGRYDLVFPALIRGYTHMRTRKILPTWCIYAIHLGLYHMDTNNSPKGLTLLQEAIDIARNLKSDVLLGLSLRALALFSPPEDAAFFLNRALGIARTFQRSFDEAACLLLLARLTSDKAERKRLWQAGVEILKRLKADAWLEGHSIENPPVLAFSR